MRTASPQLVNCVFHRVAKGSAIVGVGPFRKDETL